MEPAVFVCISLLGEAVGATIAKDVGDLLEAMLGTGLSAALTTALRDLAMKVPQLKRDISEGLLRMLSQVLMQKQSRHLSMQRHLPLPGSGSATGGSGLLTSDSQDTQSIVLALTTLGSFNFDGEESAR